MSAVRNLVNGSLKSKLIQLIQLRGPMTVADYMKFVLINPESGFYMNDDVFGVKGHFTTNPEISQMYGEILGVWIYQEWQRFKCPKPLRLVEFGPGRGTLMSDITRTLESFKQTKDNLQLKMIEMSPHLKEIQRQTIAKNNIDLLNQTEWHSHIDALDKDQPGFTAYIAHEFLDALPIHKFVREPKTNSWRELLIDYDQKHELRFCISKQPSLSTRLLIPPDFTGDHLEVCPQAALHLEKVATRLNQPEANGCMLVCDYGFEEISDDDRKDGNVTSLRPARSCRDTLRAFKDHELWPPLKNPGEADITADVDFGYLKRHIQDKATIFGSVDQGSYLLKCGLQSRLNRLLEKADEKEKEVISSESHMMVNEMGQRYRLLALFPKSSKPLFDGDPPAGFDTPSRRT